MESVVPYMHNGTFNSLKEILKFYEDLSNEKSRNPLIPNDSLDEIVINTDVGVKNMSKIISFLNALNDEEFDKLIPE